MLVSLRSFAQGNDADLLGMLQQKFDTIENFSVEFTQSHNGGIELSGKFYFKKENKIKIVSGKLNIVSNGTTSWNYNKAENKVIISNVDESEPDLFSLNEIVYGFPEECDVSFGGNQGERVITLSPAGYKYNFDTVKLWLNGDDLISKIIIIDSAMGETGVAFSNYNLNIDLPDSEFTFIIPEGSKIIDLR
jgi:outer membrane lipoprotein-sorting protein